VETALYVDDLDRACRFYQETFGFPLIFEERPRMAALAAGGKQVLRCLGRSSTPG